MKLIQAILLVGIGGSFVLYFAYLRSTGRDRLLTVILFLGLSLAIIFPDSTTAVAQALGVGRGTDLAFYLFSVFILFATVVLHLKIRRMETAITRLTRELAINNSQTEN